MKVFKRQRSEEELDLVQERFQKKIYIGERNLDADRNEFGRVTVETLGGASDSEEVDNNSNAERSSSSRIDKDDLLDAGGSLRWKGDPDKCDTMSFKFPGGNQVGQRRKVDDMFENLLRKSRRRMEMPRWSDRTDTSIPSSIGPNPTTDHALSMQLLKLPNSEDSIDNEEVEMTNSEEEEQNGSRYSRLYREVEDDNNLQFPRKANNLTHSEWFVSDVDDDSHSETSIEATSSDDDVTDRPAGTVKAGRARADNGDVEEYCGRCQQRIYRANGCAYCNCPLPSSSAITGKSSLWGRPSDVSSQRPSPWSANNKTAFSPTTAAEKCMHDKGMDLVGNGGDSRSSLESMDTTDS